MSFAGQDPLERSTIDKHGWLRPQELESGPERPADPELPRLMRAAVASRARPGPAGIAAIKQSLKGKWRAGQRRSCNVAAPSRLRGGAVRDILETITRWWAEGETFGLATVVGTFRSAPRDPGAALAVAGGEVIGSVSGGCVEGAVYELATEVIGSGEPVLQRYGFSDDDAFAVGLTCGGILDIFVEPVSKATVPRAGRDPRGGRAGASRWRWPP